MMLPGLKYQKAPYDKYPYLRRRMRGGRTSAQWEWSPESLREGLQYFHDLYQHYPGEKEIDDFMYLPTARQIRRKFGGLGTLRRELQLASSGERKMKKALRPSAPANEERMLGQKIAFYEFLTSRVSEMRVHERKIVRTRGVVADFFVYTSDKNGVCIDLCSPKNVEDLARAVDAAGEKYADVPHAAYLVLVGASRMGQAKVDELMGSRRRILPPNIRVYAADSFKKKFNDIVIIEH